MTPSSGDSVDQVVAGWAHERPDLPADPINVILRMNRLRALFDDELSAVFARFDLTAADFAVVASLRRMGSPYTVPQSVLMSRLALTSGTISVRLARLEAKGVVQRRPKSDDGRRVLVTLTERGLQLFDEVGPDHLANEDVLLSALTAPERQLLADLLRKLLMSFEHERTNLSFGVSVAPAHVARRARTAVGLTDRAGLLVRQVVPDSAADRAGLRSGDLLIALDGQPLRSCLDLARSASDTAGSPLTLRVVSGEDERNVHVLSTPDSLIASRHAALSASGGKPARCVRAAAAGDLGPPTRRRRPATTDGPVARRRQPLPCPDDSRRRVSCGYAPSQVSDGETAIPPS